MNQDVTHNVSTTDSEKLSLILTTVQSFTVRFDNVDTRLNTIDSRLGTIDSRLVRVEHTVNDMQPVLQQAVTDIAQLQQGQRDLQGGLLQLQEGQRELQEGLIQVQEGQRQLEAGQEVLRSGLEALHHSVRYRFLILSGSVKAAIRDLDKRVTWLELNQNPPKPQT